MQLGISTRHNTTAACPQHHRSHPNAPPPRARLRSLVAVVKAASDKPGSSSSSASKKRRISPVSKGLISVLEDELKVEKERYRTPSAVLDGPPGGYELQDRPNCTTLLLARSFGEDEDVFVEVDINNQEDAAAEDLDDDEVDDEEDVLPAVVFSVNITKEDRMMTFNCEADGESIVIRHVSLSDAADLGDGDDDDEDASLEFSPYTGPVFDELDDTLQQAFADYLEERGITDEFGVYLMELVHDKLEVEYMNWLQRTQDFVKS